MNLPRVDLKPPRYVGIILYAPILLFYYYISKRYDSIYEQATTDQDFERVKFFGKFYLTGWNFSCQAYFLVVAMLDEIATLFPNKLESTKKLVHLVRRYIFTAVVFPVGLLVTSLFWTLYAIDRELVFPRSLDAYYFAWMTHSVHSFILLPLLIEILLSRRNELLEDVDFRRSLPLLSAFLLAYQLSFFYVYFRYNVWLYPIFENLTWGPRMLFMLALYAVTVCFLQLGICAQGRLRRKVRFALSEE